MKILWRGALCDLSGYGNANRSYVRALMENGVDIHVDPQNFEAIPPKLLGDDYTMLQELMKKPRLNDSSYDAVVHHYVPNEVKVNPKAFNIGYNTWETSTIPSHWVKNINSAFKINFVPSTFNKIAYENSGVTIPIRVIPHVVVPPKNIENLTLPGGDLYRFLSVFQWTPRKNPRGLVTAYCAAFAGQRDTLLVLKTYRSNTSEGEKAAIRQELRQIVEDTGLKPEDVPPITLVLDHLTSGQLWGLYRQCDCYVSAHRGEGFGLPMAEATISGLPVITTGYGGQCNFLASNNNPDFYAVNRLMPFTMTPVSGMRWIPHYDVRQWWAEPDLEEFVWAMQRAKNGHKMNVPNIESYCSPETITKQIIRAIEENS